MTHHAFFSPFASLWVFGLSCVQPQYVRLWNTNGKWHTQPWCVYIGAAGGGAGGGSPRTRHNAVASRRLRDARRMAVDGRDARLQHDEFVTLCLRTTHSTRAHASTVLEGT